tara:strand:- start:87 stop:440 length:354 start_codon:yes stop_codon:yes gene_type:complete
MVSSFELAGHVVGIMVDRDLTEEYLEEIHKIILEKIALHGKINLFCEIQKGQQVPFKILMKELKFKYENSKNLNKLAFISDTSWMRTLMGINDLVLPCEVRTFDSTNRLDAINWISH